MDPKHFVGYAPRWIALDKLFVIVAVSGGLLGLRVGGQLMPAPSDKLPSDPRAYFRKRLASRYEGRNLADPMLASLDKHNFFLPSAEVISATLRPRRSLWTGKVPNSGILLLRSRVGRPHRFILLGRQDHREVASVLTAAAIALDASAATIS